MPGRRHTYLQTSKNQTSDYVHSNLELASTWSSDRRVLRAVVL